MIAAAFLALLACSENSSDTVVVETDNATLTLLLRNPTLDADPLAGVSSIRVDIVVDGAIAYSSSFDYPDGTPEFTGVGEYGALRFEVAGIGGGEVISYGRSAEIAVTPGEDQLVPVTFLPVNHAFALASDTVVKRSEHLAFRLKDGNVLLLGGHNRERSSSWDTIEIFDFSDFEFSNPGATLGQGVAHPAFGVLDDDTYLIAGGETIEGSARGGARAIYTYEPLHGSLKYHDELAIGRDTPCAGHYSRRSFWVLGGTGTGTTGDLVLWDSTEESWYDMDVMIQDGLESEHVVACIGNEQGQVFVLGDTPTSTGIWDVSDSTPPGQAFDPVHGDYDSSTFVDGPLLAPIEEGRYWIAGGASPSTGQVTADGREFRMDSRSFVDSVDLAVPRYRPSWDDWIEDLHFVVGCGYSDTSLAHAVNSVEFVSLDPQDAGSILQVPLERNRPGCRVTTLLDGSILVTGGYDANSDRDAMGAAIIVPYLGD